MLVPSAEESFRRGLVAWSDDRKREAMAFFEAAIELERKLGESRPQPRYLSHYGLCLGLVKRQWHEGVRFCREAVAQEQFDPDLRWNLGRVLLGAGRRGKAREALLRGLRIQKDHPGIRRELRSMGTRSKPPIPFLPRANPINVYLGRKRGAKKRTA